MTILMRHFPWLDTTSERVNITHPEKGAHRYLRHIKPAIQARLAELISHEDCPRVTLFGSPHVDNYVRTNTGCGLADFDRALQGPYLSDWCYSLLSLALKNEQGPAIPLNEAIFSAYQQAYLEGLTSQKTNYITYTPLLEQPLKKWEQSSSAYLQKGKGWVKKSLEQPLLKEDPFIAELLRQFFVNRNQPGLEGEYEIGHAGMAMGSMGRPHFVFALISKDDNSEVLLLDIKPAKDYRNAMWPHDKWYTHPFEHEGQRMIAASKLLAPAVTAGESYATLNGMPFWGREIPTTNQKIKGQLSLPQLSELAEAMGSQTGKGHAATVGENHLDALLSHINSHSEQVYQAIQTIQLELIEAWKFYLTLGRVDILKSNPRASP